MTEKVRYRDTTHTRHKKLDTGTQQTQDRRKLDTGDTTDARQKKNRHRETTDA